MGQQRDTDRPAAPARGAALRLLAVHGPTGRRAAAQVVAGAAVVSVLVSPLLDPVAVAVLLLVLGGITLLRVLAVPAGLQALTGGALLAAAWASVLQVYERVWWADIAAHLAVIAVLAASAGTLMARGGLMPSARSRAGWWGVIVTTTAVGTTLAVVWEIAEWWGHSYVDPTVEIAPGDTVGDLAAGIVGAAVAGVVLARRGADR
ncbi:hypothetical protein [Georgenia sp. MJ170]|uniref:hypothetical protein n=1 Tax=Georgenia sunbinii TaxID=3117728 RepID=UPI002F25EBF9